MIPISDQAAIKIGRIHDQVNEEEEEMQELNGGGGGRKKASDWTKVGR